MNPKTFKIGRKMNLVNLLSLEKKISLEKLIEIGGYESAKELKDDLGQLFMLGSYPYSPDDLIEVDFDGSSVSLSVPVSLDKSVRLNVQEWLAIKNILDEDLSDPVFDSGREIIHSILLKINSIIPISTFKTFEKNTVIIEQAIKEKIRIKFNYLSRKNKTSAKSVEPWLLYHEKIDYLVGLCLEAKAPRIYRIESMHDLELTHEKFVHSGSAQEVINSLGKPSPMAELIVLESAWFNLSRQMDLIIINQNAKINKNKGIHVKTPIIDEEWFIDTVSRFGKNIVVIGPAFIRNKIISHFADVRLPKEFGN